MKTVPDINNLNDIHVLQTFLTLTTLMNSFNIAGGNKQMYLPPHIFITAKCKKQIYPKASHKLIISVLELHTSP
jgi:hypothetical protein